MTVLAIDRVDVANYVDALFTVYLILIMVFKPSGLLGEQTRDAG